MKDLVESAEAIEVILSSFFEAVNTNSNWETIDGRSNVMYKYFITSHVLSDVVNVYDHRRIQVLSKRNRLGINQIQVLSLKRTFRQFQARLGLTLVIVPCATNLCLEFTYQGTNRKHCFNGTKSTVIAIGAGTEFKLASKESSRDFATVLFC